MPTNDKEKQREYSKRHYENNKESRKAAVREQEKSKRRFLDAVKSFPCIDCGLLWPPYVMQFDHLDPVAKTGNIATMVMRVGWSKLIEEIMKCDIVCANCHAIRTHSK